MIKANQSIIMIIALFLTSTKLGAQESNTGNWLIYFGNQAISKKVNWHNEVQYRNYNLVGDLQQLLLRTGIGINLSENNNNLLLGYGFIRSANYIPGTDEKTTVDEHRLYQQFITRQSFGRVNLQHRYRLEERFLSNDIKLRMRYFLSVNVPVNKTRMDQGAVYASAYNEIFINGESPLFDRNRVYAAVGYVFSKHLRAEIGFMSQILEKNHRNQFQIVIFNNLPFINN